MKKAKEVADYILSLSDPDIGDIISHLKLQKLLYYVQGFHLALFNDPLFEEEIKAWEYGPVVEDLYHVYKEHGSNPIPIPEDIEEFTLSKEQKDLIKEVYQVYGQFSAWKLKEMTHDEAPWRNTASNEVISYESMKNFFVTQVNTQEDGQEEQDKG